MSTNLLDRQIAVLSEEGWEVVSRNETTAQLKKPKELGKGGIILFILLLIGGFLLPPFQGWLWIGAIVALVLTVFEYVTDKDELFFLTLDDLEKQPQQSD